jgi:hypothetical protein
MKKCIVILCVLVTPAFAQEPNNDGFLSFFLRFDDRESNLSAYEEDKLLDYVYDLFLSESVIIELRREGNSFAHDELTAQRYNYFSEMCREYELSESTTSIRIVNTRFEEDLQAHARIIYRDPSIQKMVARKEVFFTHPNGWRAQCFHSDAAFLKGTQVRILRSPEELNQLNLLTVDEMGDRLEVLAVVALTFARDTLFPSPVKFHIPLHGMAEVGCMEYALMSNDEYSFPANGGKASVKREDGLMLWKLDTDRSGVYVIARKAPDSQVIKFVAPYGYAILSGYATSNSPYMSVKAAVSDNQLSASFHNMPEIEHVTCEFTLIDLQGNLCTIAAVPAKTLMNESFLSFLRHKDPVLPENLVAQKGLNH